jgi:membrane-associated phospholipid phosphatase
VRCIAAVSLLILALPRAAAGAPLPVDPAREGVRAPDRPALRLDGWGLAALAGGTLAVWGVGAATSDEPLVACRWCEPSQFDRGARDLLRWRDTKAAASASDTLLLAVPLGSLAAAAWLGGRDGGWREAAEDVLAVAGALALTAPITDMAKHGTARLRPGAWAAGGPSGEGDLHAFFSGHTSRTFAAATAAAQVARLRGRSSWKWIAAVGFAASAATGYLRVAADAHWATDVIAGAAAGTAIGLAVPPLVLRRRSEALAKGRGLQLAPAPGGLALVF